LQVIEYRTGGDTVVRKLPGLQKSSDVTLKRGVTSDPSLWNWYKSSLQGNPFRTNVVVTLLDAQRQPVRRWKLSNAWIRKYSGPALNSTGGDVAIESIELTHEGLDLE
jgi:phage tail-like protein